MRIRDATLDDLSSLAAIEASAIGTFRGSSRAFLLDLPLPPPGAFTPFVASGLAWIAEIDDDPVGFAVCESFPEALHLTELSVRQDRQRQGAGRALIARVVQAAESMGLTAITLSTYRHIPWNAPYYARLGFVELTAEALNRRMVETLAREAKLNGDSTVRCFMRLALPAVIPTATTPP